MRLLQDGRLRLASHQSIEAGFFPEKMAAQVWVGAQNSIPMDDP